MDLLKEAKLYDQERKLELNRQWITEFFQTSVNSESELLKYYVNSRTMLLSCAEHQYLGEFDDFPRGHVLDFGGGAGVWSVGLANSGFIVDYYDINELCKDFMNWLNPARVKILECESDFEKYDYDYIVLRDVLEHLYDYRPTVKKLISHLKVGGVMFCKNEFLESCNREFNWHFADKYNFKKFMTSNGMELLKKNFWLKRIEVKD